MMTLRTTFRLYRPADHNSCLRLFDANCPSFFAPSERPEYVEFLQRDETFYRVCELDGAIVGAFGVRQEGAGRASLRWILIAPDVQGRGLGTVIMDAAGQLCVASRCTVLTIAASHKSAPFFARFGAREVGRTMDGWGPDMHRVDMELPITTTMMSA